MKKPEIKEYLESLYGLDVVNVKTMNIDGESSSSAFTLKRFLATKTNLLSFKVKKSANSSVVV